MRISKHDVILMSIDDISTRSDRGRSFDRKLFLRALDLTEGSFRVYMSRLYRDGSLERVQGPPGNGIVSKVRITPKGRSRTRKVFGLLKDRSLGPERHSVPSEVSLLGYYNKLEDPYDRTLLLSYYFTARSFDLPNLLKGLRTYRKAAGMKDGPSETDRSSCRSFVEDLLSCTILGSCCIRGSEDETLDEELLLLSQADLSRHQGRLLEAEKVLELLLADGKDLRRDILFIARMELFEVKLKSERTEDALNELEVLDQMASGFVHKGLVWMARGRLHSLTGVLDKGLKELTKAVNIFKDLGSPLLLSIALWHRGNTYLIMKRMNLAETDLRASLKNARGSGNVCMEARSLMDLAAIMMTKNDLLQAARYLRKAEKVCWELGDTETLSWVEARWSDYYMLKGDMKEAALHRSKAMGVNYPHPFKLERDLMFNLVRPGTDADRI